eukprot:scaffold3139_cov110-Isochrysis_galbana.AAC.8
MALKCEPLHLVGRELPLRGTRARDGERGRTSLVPEQSVAAPFRRLEDIRMREIGQQHLAHALVLLQCIRRAGMNELQHDIGGDGHLARTEIGVGAIGASSQLFAPQEGLRIGGLQAAQLARGGAGGHHVRPLLALVHGRETERGAAAVLH